MSRFFSGRFSSLTPYVPGEQPSNMAQLVKLNTNESPFPPSGKALKYAEENTRVLNLYSDPDAKALTRRLAEVYGVGEENVLVGNGSDEILYLLFNAYADDSSPALFSDITYGFYPVFCSISHIPSVIIPLREDYSLSVDDYIGKKGTVFIANPNAPTGMALPLSEIERLLQSDEERIVVIDEAYVDFGGESAIALTKKYRNLVVCQTFSKSRSMAGGRLGYAIADAALIQDLNTLKYSINPYNVNSMTQAMGLGILSDEEYTKANCRAVMENRAYTVSSLEAMGFTVLPSSANFIFVRTDKVCGDDYYKALREKGILVRHFSSPRLSDWCRVSIGSRESMEKYIKATKEILEERA